MKKGKQNIFTRLGNALSVLGGKTMNKSIEFNTAPNGSFSGLENYFDSYNLKTFQESLYLFIGVSMIRETVSSIPLQMYQIKNKDGEVEQIFDDPFLDLLERPNGVQTQKEFWKLSVAYYLLGGETFWYLDNTTPGAIPTQMVNMRPDNVTILLSESNRQIIGYEFNQANGQTIKLAIEDVLHIKNIDPLNPTRGIGVVRPATQRIVTEKEASKHQANTFRNQGRPDIAVFTSVDLTEEAIEDGRVRWQKAFGEDKGSQVAFFGDSTKSLQVLNTNPKEMDFINTQGFLRDDILASLHIPKAMITSDDVNLANSKIARINYVKEACLPVLDTFLDIINNKFLNDMAQDRFVTYESPVNEDRELLLKEAVDLKNAGIVTIDEARALMNYPSIDGGNILAAQSSPFTLAMANATLKKKAISIMTKRPVLMKKFKAIEAVTKMLVLEKGVKRSQNPVFNTQELKNAYVKSYHKNVDAKAKHFKQTIDVYNREFEKRIIDHIEKFGINPKHFFDVTTELVEAKKIFNPLMANLYSKIGQETLDNIANGFANKAAEKFNTREEFLRQLEQRAEFFITSMLNTDYEELSAILVEQMSEGAGVDAIGRSIRKYFDDMSVARAKTIARTETGRLVSQATNEAYEQSEFVTGKEWITAGDDRVRDEHVMNAGVIVSTNGVFPSGEQYPAQHTINCRCVLAPAV